MRTPPNRYGPNYSLPDYCGLCGKVIPPRARDVILLGHAQDTEYSDQGQISKNMALDQFIAYILAKNVKIFPVFGHQKSGKNAFYVIPKSSSLHQNRAKMLFVSSNSQKGRRRTGLKAKWGKPLFGGIKTSRRNVPFYFQTLQESLPISLAPKHRE